MPMPMTTMIVTSISDINSHDKKATTTETTIAVAGMTMKNDYDNDEDYFKTENDGLKEIQI